MRKLIVLMLFILLLPNGFADDVYRKGENILLSQGFSVNGALSSTLDVNVSFRDPNNTLLVSATPMVYNPEAQEYQLLIEGAKITKSGKHCALYFATDGVYNATEQRCYEITTTGRSFDEGSGLTGLGMMAGVLGVAFFFMIFGFRLSGETGTRPLGLFFSILAIMMVVYSLYLGLTYSIAFFDYDPFESTQTAIFNSALYLLSGVGVISFIMMSIAVVREFGKGKMMKNYGEGFDPITQTYQ